MTDSNPDSLCSPQMTPPVEELETQLCIVGGGISGVCAAIAAAREGTKVILVQDRAVLGGNASSEVRMWICGAHGRFYKESGILEELQLLNYLRNPGLKYTVWDTVLYEAVLAEPNITLILSCSICDVETEGDRIQSVKGWHLTRQRWMNIRARQFIDCSGDSVLRFSGAKFRWGREDRTAEGETYAREEADRKTMGNSLLIQLRRIDPEDHVPFFPPPFARKLDESHPRASNFMPGKDNFWWLEIGGEQDTIADADTTRDELYAIAYGVWDFIKNHPDGRGHSWELEWIGSLPGKRENVRYVGAYTLKQQDIESQGKFPDTIAYGGWTMDDHPTAAFDHPGEDTTHYAAPSPYGIPFGVLYSINIRNLMFAGRNISATHLGMSSTRVMGTCSLLGQAAGTAAAMALRYNIDPADVSSHIDELQNRLMEADQWLPGRTKAMPQQTATSDLAGDLVSGGELESLRDGQDRRLPDGTHSVSIQDGGHLEFRWESAVPLEQLRLVVQSNLSDPKKQPCSYGQKTRITEMPKEMPRNFSVQIPYGDSWKTIAQVKDNYRRLIQLSLPGESEILRIVFEKSWGGQQSTVFACEVGSNDYQKPPNPVEWPEPHWTGKRFQTA
ncbi:MAG: FAD-dependent oxidoreductase [Puniceicoccales bacterium]